MFWSLGYNSIPPLELSPQNPIGFNMDFGRWVEHSHRRSRSKGDNQEQRV